MAYRISVGRLMKEVFWTGAEHRDFGARRPRLLDAPLKYFMQLVDALLPYSASKRDKLNLTAWFTEAYHFGSYWPD